jgi:acetyl-CoA carboxylase biotin carboxylase subunit
MKRIFIANRGEIAVRIIRAIRELDLTAIIGYSDADRSSLGVRLADEAYWLGPSPSSESYLNIPRLIELMQMQHCDAVHPGYGFLSERAAFAKACENAGITFIGPRSEIIDLMGDKTRARQAIVKSGTPVVPGAMEPLKDSAEASRLADEFGYPVMIKAAAGGGGKGMRVAHNRAQLDEGFRMAQSEALSAFDDSAVYIEKLIENPHHVEVQVLGDKHGNVIHLGERECSIQRRHQKVIEESPSPFISPETRRKMTELAARAAKEIGYTNAGTMEFLVDADQNFYFLEMNTRLQVEHPVTEMVTGVDIVQEQIRIASGEPLSHKQSDITFRGAAIECRIYAEDPDHNFMPSPGKIEGLRVPGGPGIRDDSGIYEGFEVPIYYDPILAKLVAWGATRKDAIARMSRALEEYYVVGIKTAIPFYQRILHHPDFVKGNVNTGFLAGAFATVDQGREHPLRDIALLATAIYEFERMVSTPTSSVAPTVTRESRWKTLGRKEGLR